MSLYDKASLVQIPSGYKAADDKLYSVVPSNGDGDFTIDSDADATRVNKDGLIESVLADQARLDYDPTNPQDPHLLLEPTRRNIVDYSEEFNQWTLVSGVSVTTNQSTSPNGSNTADKITSSASNSRVNKTFSFSNNSTMVFSVFIKNIDATNIKIGISDNITGVCNATFTFSTETITAANQGSWTNTSASVQNFANGWYRLILISTKGAGSNLAPRIEFTESGKNIFAWGAQLEDNGSFGSVDYPTSYIPTAGSQVTRTQDLISNSYTGLTSASGTIFIDLDTKGFDLNYAKTIALRDTVTGDSIRFEPFQSGSAFKLGIFGLNGANVLPLFPNEATLPINNKTKIAFTFSGSNFKFSQDGYLVTGTYTGTPRQYNQIGGANITGGAMHNAIIHQFLIFNEVLTDAELITLTT